MACAKLSHVYTLVLDLGQLLYVFKTCGLYLGILIYKLSNVTVVPVLE